MAGVAAFFPGQVKASRPTDGNLAVPAAGAASASDGLLPTRDQFAACLHGTFSVQRDGLSAVPLVLVDVANPATSRDDANSKVCFRATFRGSARSPLGQDTYSVEAKGMGEFPMFLVPVGRRVGGARTDRNQEQIQRAHLLVLQPVDGLG